MRLVRWWTCWKIFWVLRCSIKPSCSVSVVWELLVAGFRSETVRSGDSRGFDVRRELAGTEINGYGLPHGRLPCQAERIRATIGVITVPVDKAQEVPNRLSPEESRLFCGILLSVPASVGCAGRYRGAKILPCTLTLP